MKKIAKGFTLMELMIVVMIIAVIAGFTYPLYDKYVMRGHRNEARQALTAAAQYYVSNYSRARRYDKVYDPDKPFSPADWGDVKTLSDLGLDKTQNGLYQIKLTFVNNKVADSEETAQGFVLEAQAIGRQARDKCKFIQLTHSNTKNASSASLVAGGSITEDNYKTLGLSPRNGLSLECWRG
ncbi:MAG: prepilin-type N-terminal cleavage/methylation domain-containing protein [Cardiobacteriaceae bacterium]|nr:prepilin-type N-terminal cleavage/methylation domain-containing protein [Cardiobacteriaceae bacterium]